MASFRRGRKKRRGIQDENEEIEKITGNVGQKRLSYLRLQ